ncbi:MAG TPA: 50S ribosomal protein L13 [Acidimicrobiia bacterium]
MKTYTAKPGEIERHWYLVDAESKTLGRLATQIADVLRGKGKATYTPHVDTGDFVIVVNAGALAVSARKGHDKLYHRHTGYPGGIKTENLEHLLARNPERVVRLAVKRMLPKGPLGRKMLKKLKVHPGPTHPHAAQQPKVRPLPARSLARPTN